MDWVYYTNWITNFFYLFWITALVFSILALFLVLAGKVFERLGYFTVTGSLLKGITLAWLLYFGYEIHRWWEQDEPNLFVYKGGYVPEKWMEILGYIFAVIWVMGAAAGMLYYIYRLVLSDRCAKNSFPCNREILRVFEQVKKEYKFKKKHISVRCSYTENGAITVRVFRPVILLPAWELSEEELLVIFRHELMHVKSHDLFYKNLAEILCRLYFLNPAVFWLKKELDRWMEYVCDYSVCRKYGHMKIYYGTILDFAEKSVASPALASSLVEQESQLLDRMKKVIKNSRQKKCSKLLAVLLGLFLIAGTNAVYAFSMEGAEAVRKMSAAHAVEVQRDCGQKEAAEHLVLNADTKNVKIGILQEDLLSTGTPIYEMDWKIKGHEKTGMPVIHLEEGNFIRFYAGGITNGKSIRAALRQPDGSICYADMEAGMIHIFHAKEAGDYQLYLENTGADDVRVLGGYIVYTKKE